MTAPTFPTTSPSSAGADVAQAGLPRSFVRPCLLLSLAEGESHGYDLLEQVRDLGLVAADAGGLYRTLRSMERDDLLRSWWEPSQSGPARRTYALTDEGRRALRSALRSLRETHRLLGDLLGQHEHLLDGERL